MRKRTVLFIAIISGVLVFNSFAYNNEPVGFRNISWQTSESSLGKLKQVKSYGSYKISVKNDENLDFYGLKATVVQYGFVSNRLEDVTIIFEPYSKDIYQKIQKTLFDKFGVGEKISDTDYFWTGDVTNIKLQKVAEGIEIIYSDNKTVKDRFNEVDKFKNSLQDQYGKLLEENDTKTAINLLREWIDKNGGDLLDSYTISDGGAQVFLTFKGAGIHQVSPSINRKKLAVEEDKIYLVSDMNELLQKKEETLRNKEIYLKGVVVDGVRGFGCNDYAMITDKQFSELYLRKYDKNLTDEEKKQLKEMPVIKTGQTLDMARGILKYGEEVVYKGRFFDPSTKPCKDGATRFVITGKK